MSKISTNTFDIKGKSGQGYNFDMYTLDHPFPKSGGIYIFTCRSASANVYSHDIIYCGKTEDLSTRFNDHHKKDEIAKKNANCICVLAVSNEIDRTRIEIDILKGNKFHCNEIHN